MKKEFDVCSNCEHLQRDHLMHWKHKQCHYSDDGYHRDCKCEDYID